VTCAINPGPRPDEAQVTIRDRGEGIPEMVRKNLFARFVAEPGREKRSSGLGLSFVKTVMDRHKGHIECESGPEIGGTCFTLTFTVLPPD
jgi:signal transduction histidine kinase